MALKRMLKMGMVGGGPGAFIGEVHRKAARMDGLIEVVGGAFARDLKRSKVTGRAQKLDPKRVYSNTQELIEKELQLSEGERMDFVAVVTPNNSHFPIASALLKSGFHVMCEKPMTFTLDEARALKRLVTKTGKVFGLMHNYTGYPMVKLAKDMVAQGDLGEIRKIVVRYPQGWLATPQEKKGNVQAIWRTDPKQSGASGCGGDIGTHAAHLAETISGLKITHLCADVTTFVPGRHLDDDVNCLLKYDNGAKGVLHASQISVGEENGLAIWLYGTKAGLEWHQEWPNILQVKRPDGPLEIWRQGNDYVAQKSPGAARGSRLPAGHPEAFLGAFANHYVNFAETVTAALEGKSPDELALDFPGVDEGLRGMLFLEALLASHKSKQKWTKIRK